MHARQFRFLTVLAFVTITAMAATSFAQFGHPLKGTWIGDWGPNKDAQTRVVLELHWDGKAVTGTINPGTNGVPLKVATFDAPMWTVHFEAEGKDRAGAAVRYVIDGKLENVGAFARFITGTWTQGSAKGTFKITRT
jgi:hypothetical protein